MFFVCNLGILSRIEVDFNDTTFISESWFERTTSNSRVQLYTTKPMCFTQACENISCYLNQARSSMYWTLIAPRRMWKQHSSGCRNNILQDVISTSRIKWYVIWTVMWIVKWKKRKMLNQRSCKLSIYFPKFVELYERSVISTKNLSVVSAAHFLWS